jgi:hypothetical protein
MEGGWEVVKRSGRDEPISDCYIHVHGSNIRNSLYSYLYLKLAKCCLSYNHLCLHFNKIGEEGRTGSAWK